MLQITSKLPYTVSPDTHEIIPLESADETFVMTGTSNALNLIFLSYETQLHRGHLISRAIKQALAESTVSAKFAADVCWGSPLRA